MLKKITLLLSVLFLLSACGGGGNTSKTTSVSVTGYIEDDPIAQAKIKLSGEGGSLLTETSADSDGKFLLEDVFTTGKVYVLEGSGLIGERQVTLHSTFEYSEASSEIIININPLTELKYQLVQSGKSIDQAETLIRNYFLIVSGDKLERNRFDITSQLAVKMQELAKLYGGTLPIDSLLKIKEDIIDNDVLDFENQEFAFKNLLQSERSLESSSSSVEVGTNVTVNLEGANNLNDNYLIEWIGLPNDNNGTNLVKTFTANEAGDIQVGVNVYKKNAEGNILVETQATKINFYTNGESKTIDITGDNQNIVVGDDVSITVPKNALSAGTQISYNEVITDTSDFIKVFNFKPSGTIFAKPMEVRVKYDPSRISDPRKLLVSRLSDDGEQDQLKIKEIDLVKNELIFETEHFSKFIIEDDTYIWEDTSFDQWDDKKVGGPDVNIKGILFKPLSPYHYLAESISLYCDANKASIRDKDCVNWVRYMQSPTGHSERVVSGKEEAFQSFFNLGDNYDIFTNNYYSWLLVKDPLPFPHTTDCTFARECFDAIKKRMHSNSFSGKARNYNVFSYLNKGSKVAKLFVGEQTKKRMRASMKMAKYVNLGYNIYNDLTENDIRTDKYIIQKRFADFLGKKLLYRIPVVGKPYGKILQSASELTDGWKGVGSPSKSKMQGVIFPMVDDAQLDKYLYYLFSGLDSERFLEIESTGIAPDYSVSVHGSFMINDTILSNSESAHLAKHLFEIEDADKVKANAYLASLYSTLSLYRQLYFSTGGALHEATNAKVEPLRKFTRDYMGNLSIAGSNAAIEILQYANIVQASELVSDKQARITNYFLKKKSANKYLKKSLKKAKASTINDGSTVPVLDGFDDFLTQIKINIPESIWESTTVKKLNLEIEKYAFTSKGSTSTTKLVFDITTSDGKNDFSEENLAKDSFQLTNGKYRRSLASVFNTINSGDFQNSFIVVKANILISRNGKDKLLSKNYQFITYLDTEDELLNELDYGKLVIAIKDTSTGGVISDASVTLLPVDITNTSDGDGNTSFSNIPPSTYTLKVEKEGYQTLTISDVEVAIGEATNIEASLVEEVGDFSLRVNVKDESRVNVNQARVVVDSAECLTQGNGNCTLYHLSKGTYDVKVYFGDKYAEESIFIEENSNLDLIVTNKNESLTWTTEMSNNKIYYNAGTCEGEPIVERVILNSNGTGSFETVVGSDENDSGNLTHSITNSGYLNIIISTQGDDFDLIVIEKSNKYILVQDPADQLKNRLYFSLSDATAFANSSDASNFDDLCRGGDDNNQDVNPDLANNTIKISGSNGSTVYSNIVTKRVDLYSNGKKVIYVKAKKSNTILEFGYCISNSSAQVCSGDDWMNRITNTDTGETIDGGTTYNTSGVGGAGQGSINGSFTGGQYSGRFKIINMSVINH